MSKNLDQPECTICFNLGFLYRQSVIKNDKVSTAVIKECFIMAKKMNKKLLEYNQIVDVNTEEDWLKELNEMGKRNVWKIYHR